MKQATLKNGLSSRQDFTATQNMQITHNTCSLAHGTNFLEASLSSDRLLFCLLT